ncbi:chromosome partition protein MukF [Klebsiella pneumoniae subsp. ozaenae]|nr:chromosome partition protein MukF [Klebsiella pneumoniae subsp. ozaenae]
MPVVYGVMTHEEHPGPDVLLLERLRGVPVEAPTRTPARWEQLQEQIVEALLAWHRQDSGGCVGMVDNTQENLWPNWYRQRVEILWSTLNLYQDTGLTMQDKRLLFRSRECLPELFRDFNDNAVLVHGNFTLRSMLKDPRSDQLLAMVGPGMMLWAPREYELFRLAEGGQAEQLLWRYLQQAPVSEAFVWRRWLYLLWDEVDSLVNTGRFDRARFDLAAKSLLPWLA